MALSRTPSSIQVNGAALLVKGESTGLFSNFQRVPGLASFTLPDETGGTNEIQLMDGTVAYAQAAGVGTITGSVGAITAHPTHEWLAAKRRSGAQITVTIVRPAGSIVANEANSGAKNGAGGSDITFTGSVVDSMREGQLIAVGGTADSFTGYVSYNVTPQAADDHKFRAILQVDPETKTVAVSPSISTALAAASGNKYSLRSPGIVFANIPCTVNGFGDGDFQAGGAMSANISLQPSGALGRAVEWQVLSELAASSSAFDGAFEGLTAVS